MMPCPRCQDSGRPGYVRSAGNRIYRPCTSCDGKGVITEARATFDDVDLELLQLHALKRDYEKRIAELEAKLELRESCLRAYSVRIHELFGVSIVSPESWDNIPHCLANVKLRMDEQKAENARHEVLMRRLECLASITKDTIENDALWSAEFGGTHTEVA